MRQGQQQNRRGRGRGNRKGQNPLSRSFESSGPDVKIRGTAQHIAEKYMTLARDAIGSGDLVLGENYLQHAEHYNRIIIAAQTASPHDQMNGNGQRVARPEGELLPGESYGDGFDGSDDDGDGEQPGDTGNAQEQPRSYESQGHREPQNQRDHPQPRQRDGRPYEQRGYDNRDRDNRDRDNRRYEPRYQDSRNDRGNDQRGYEPRNNDQPRPINGHGEQPRTFDPAPNSGEVGEQRGEERPLADVRPPDGRQNVQGPRGRRRRGRNENAAPRSYGPQSNQFGSGDDQPAVNEPLPPAAVNTVPDGGNGGDEPA